MTENVSQGNESNGSEFGALLSAFGRALRDFIKALLTFLLWALIIILRTLTFLLTVAPRVLTVTTPVGAAALWGGSLLLSAWRAVTLAHAHGARDGVMLAFPILAAAIVPWAAANRGRLGLTVALTLDGLLLLVLFFHMEEVLEYAVIVLYLLPMAQLGLALTLIYTKQARARTRRPPTPTTEEVSNVHV